MVTEKFSDLCKVSQQISGRTWTTQSQSLYVNNYTLLPLKNSYWLSRGKHLVRISSKYDWRIFVVWLAALERSCSPLKNYKLGFKCAVGDNIRTFSLIWAVGSCSFRSKWHLKENLNSTTKRQTTQFNNEQETRTRHFTKKDLKMASKYMKNDSTLLVIREIKNHSVITYHLEWLKFKRLIILDVSEDMKQLVYSNTLQVGAWHGTAT